LKAITKANLLRGIHARMRGDRGKYGRQSQAGREILKAITKANLLHIHARGDGGKYGRQ
jgi:hypothetical protein